MSGEETKPIPLEIPVELLHQVYAQARLAFPAECCGWLSGPLETNHVTTLRTCANAQPTGSHPTAATRSAETAYVIAGTDLLAFTRGFDSPSPPRIIYHSHPNGQAYFSSTDREVATSPWGDGPTYPVQQLVVGIDEDQITEAAMFAWSDRHAGFIEIRRYPGVNQ